jgi:hypothetical protein
MKRIVLGFSLTTAATALVTGCTETAASRTERLPTEISVSASELETVNERRMSVYLTGYTYWDNTPPGSSQIARPVLRQRAGGTGTWKDPITIAVGHRIEGSRQVLDYPEGTRFYLPRLRKYAIVEDVCGDGPKPQEGPCHTGHNGLPWLDIWLGGRNMSPEKSDACARRITAVQIAIMHPPKDLPVEPGEIADGGCPTFG